MKVNTMDFDQTAHLKEQSDLVPYCFLNRLSKKIKMHMGALATKVVM